MKKTHAETINPVQRVMVSASVTGNKKLDALRLGAIGKLVSAHYTAKDSNGDGAFSLTDLEEKIVKAADAFVFTPIPKQIGQLHPPEARALFRELFKATSLMVGKQTKDPNLRLKTEDEESPNKPIVFINHQGCWDPFFDLVDHMHELGTIRQNPSELIQQATSVEEAIKILQEAHDKKTNKAVMHGDEANKKDITEKEILAGQEDPQMKRKPNFSVCVFTSASTRKPELINLARLLGNKIAEQGWGLVSGMGKTGMMGAVVEGANEVIRSAVGGKSGWVGGSNLPRIINMEGLPERYDAMWLRNDIYTRMEVMIKESQAFIVMPGGTGTVQELMALLLLKHAHEKEGKKDYLMRDKKFGDKPIVLVNYPMTHDGKQVKFWDPLVKLAETYGFAKDIKVVDSVEDAMQVLEKHHGKKSAAR